MTKTELCDLIANMMERGATKDEMTRVIDHSMVVVRSEREILNSFEKENIAELVIKYGGAHEEKNN